MQLGVTAERVARHRPTKDISNALFRKRPGQGESLPVLTQAVCLSIKTCFKWKSLHSLVKYTYAACQFNSFLDFSRFYVRRGGLTTEHLRPMLVSPPSNSAHPPTPQPSSSSSTHCYKPRGGHRLWPCSPPARGPHPSFAPWPSVPPPGLSRGPQRALSICYPLLRSLRLFLN